MNELIYMDKINIGDKVRVIKTDMPESIRRRLTDLGIIDGTRLECVGKSPMGDPSAYLIRGAVIAIRKSDCADILVEYC